MENVARGGQNGAQPSISGHHTDPGSVYSKGSKDLLEDLDLRILMQRLNLLESQRELAALRCQRFTDMLEASLVEGQGTEQTAHDSWPHEPQWQPHGERRSVHRVACRERIATLCTSRSESACGRETFDLGAQGYYSWPSTARHASSRRRSSGSFKTSSRMASAEQSR